MHDGIMTHEESKTGTEELPSRDYGSADPVITEPMTEFTKIRCGEGASGESSGRQQ